MSVYKKELERLYDLKKVSVPYHEAGHILICWFNCVTIESAILQNNASGQMAGAVNLHEGTVTPVAQAEMAIAGLVAEKIFAKVEIPALRLLNYSSFSKSSDGQIWFQRIALPKVEQRRVFTRVERKLRTHWHAVEALAAALEKKRTLTGDEIETIIQGQVHDG